ncbi:MAG TPA: (4Fe-4S)-binding protein [Candidatus Dormibacteraeota bacterium]
MRKVYRGQGIEVSFDLDICVHIGECLRGESRVFELKRRPWVLPDSADPDTVAEVVERCPSGALLYRRLDGRPDEQHAGTTVQAIRDGPLLVRGEITVTREDGTLETLPRATLCRCGQSQHKPFCDNQHLKVGFRAPGQPFKIHLSAVRPRPGTPIAKDQDPRRDDMVSEPLG